MSTKTPGLSAEVNEISGKNFFKKMWLIIKTAEYKVTGKLPQIFTSKNIIF